jgi:hypothetical protein
MTTYFSAAEGDPLSSSPDSYVMRSGANIWLDSLYGEHSMAFVGGSAYCGKCKSVGTIMGGSGCSDIARLHETTLNQRQAVAGDFVQCQCSTRPTIEARFGTNWTIEDSYGTYGYAQSPAASWSSNTSSSGSTASAFDELIVLQDEEGNPVAGLRYKLTTDDGRVYEGTTDSRGATQRVYADSPIGIVVDLVV